MMDGFKRSLYVGSLLLFFVVWCVPVHAAFKPAGEVILTNGTFLAIQADSSTRSLARGSEFYQGDRLWTGPRTKAQIRFSDGAIMTLRPDTEFSVDEYEFDDKNADRNKSLFTLVKGGFRTLTGLISRLRPDSYKIKTAYAIVGVRGTTYEALVENALWVAAWQGNISVENDGGEVNLGFGEDHNFARVTSFTAAPTGMLATPPQLLESIDPDLQEVAVVDPTDTRLVTGLLQDGNDPRLSAAEVASIDRLGFATFGGGSPQLFRAAASDGSSGSPIFFDVGADVVFRQGSAPASGVATDITLPGFPVSFGAWNASVANPASLQPDAANPSVTTPVTTDVFWITMSPPTTLPSGRVYLSFAPTNLTGVGSGSGGGPVNFVSFGADLDFAGGTLTNGNLQLSDGGNAWSADFAGQVTGSTFTTNVTGGTVLNATTCTSPGCTPLGSVTGGVTGPNADAIGGVFNLTGGPESVNGAFFAK